MFRGRVCCLSSDEFVRDDVCAWISYPSVERFLVFYFYFISRVCTSSTICFNNEQQ